MKALKYLSCILLLLTNYSLFAQDQSILIFDPNDVSTSFQSTLAQLTDDSVFVADTLDGTILNYDAAFLFFDSPNVLSESVVNTLINYTSAGNPLYLYNGPFLDSTTAPFWNHIGVEEFYGLLISVLVDSVIGVNTMFTNGVTIDTSFMSGYIPVIYGNMDSILIGDAQGWEVNTTYKSGYDSLNIILDLYNLIDNYNFLQKVLEHFGLIPPNDIDDELNAVGEFELYQNYPNPFNPSTKIKYEIPDEVRNDSRLVTLKVYDVLGNEIATLVNEEKQPGTYEVEFSATSHSGPALPAGRLSGIHTFPSGIYFYQLKAGNFAKTKKMVLLK